MSDRRVRQEGFGHDRCHSRMREHWSRIWTIIFYEDTWPIDCVHADRQMANVDVSAWR